MKRGSRLLASTIAGLWLVTAAAAGPIEIYYAPEDLPVERLATLYAEAKRSLYVAVYRLTAPPIVKALLDAKKRGVDVRVLTDREGLDDPKVQSALTTLHLAGIPIRVNRHDALMHLKQSVLDEAVNTSGSMNYTGSANRYNDERLDVIRDHAITVKAKEKFLTMWQDEERFRAWNGKAASP
jgi:phosphatidylserine/phosphatidylglycerophosphate/cardiolipin synthase-like enzyme